MNTDHTGVDFSSEIRSGKTPLRQNPPALGGMGCGEALTDSVSAPVYDDDEFCWRKPQAPAKVFYERPVCYRAARRRAEHMVSGWDKHPSPDGYEPDVGGGGRFV